MEMRAFSQVIGMYWALAPCDVLHGIVKEFSEKGHSWIKKNVFLYVSVPAHPAVQWADVMDHTILDVTGHHCQQQSHYVAFRYGFGHSCLIPKGSQSLCSCCTEPYVCHSLSQGWSSKAIRAFLSKANIFFPLLTKHCSCNTISKSTST